MTGTVLHDDVQLIPVDVAISMFGHQVGGVHEARFIKPNRMAVITHQKGGSYQVGAMAHFES